MSLLFSTISSNNLNQSYTFELSILSIKQTQYTKHNQIIQNTQVIMAIKQKGVRLIGTLGYRKLQLWPKRGEGGGDL